MPESLMTSRDAVRAPAAKGAHWIDTVALLPEATSSGRAGLGSSAGAVIAKRDASAPVREIPAMVNVARPPFRIDTSAV